VLCLLGTLLIEEDNEERNDPGQVILPILYGNMKSLKIVFVIDSLGTGGAERYLAEQLPQLGRFMETESLIQKDLRQKGHQLYPWGVMPMAWRGLLVSAMGEMIGCCFGPGQAVEKRAKLEFHRVPHLAKTRKSKRGEV
jgi:hypothetical protein